MTLTSARTTYQRAQAALLRAERALVAAALREALGHRERTAQLLGWSLRSLVRYLSQHRELAELYPGHPPNPPPARTPDGRRWAPHVTRTPILFGTTPRARAALRQITGTALEEVDTALELGRLLSGATRTDLHPRRRPTRTARRCVDRGHVLLLWVDDRGVIHDVERAPT